jgi:hypothetical protein
MKPQSGAFVKLPRTLLASAAWRSLTINARRFLDFLMIEHMRHGGKANGLLLAPWDQLEASGIGHRLVSAAIEEAERLGLVDCRRGVGRRASAYALTWLPLSDGTAPSNRWQHSEMGHEGDPLEMGHEGDPQRVTKVTHKPVVGHEGDPLQPVMGHEGDGHEGDPPYRKASYQDGAKGKGPIRGNGAGVPPGAGTAMSSPPVPYRA